jgi:hypothetical protein
MTHPHPTKLRLHLKNAFTHFVHTHFVQGALLSASSEKLLTMVMIRKKRQLCAVAILVLATASLQSTSAFVAPHRRPTVNRVSLRMGSLLDEVKTKTRFDPLELSEKTDDHQLELSNNDNNNNEEDPNQSEIWVARGILLLVAAIWGTNFPAVKYLEDLCFHPPCNHFPSEAAFARFGIAALVSFPLLINQRKDVIMAGLECGFWITLGYVTQAIALSTISAGKCAFICSLTVVFVPLASSLLFGKAIKPANLAAAALALSGVGVLEGFIDFDALLGIHPALAADMSTTAAAVSSSSVETAAAFTGPLASLAQTLGICRGDIIALGQPIGFGYAFIQIEQYQEKFKDVENRVLTIAAAQCVSVGLLSMAW